MGMLSILNARTDLWLARRQAHGTQDEGKGLIPGLNFTVELPTTTRDIPLETAAAANFPDYHGNERAESIPEFAEEKGKGFHGDKLNELGA